jgi:peptidoglycan/xylan/chitin deacetylase (PgdA/CDA1 family)
VLNGDAHSEPYLWEKGASSTFITGARHTSTESEYEYGSRSGAWRLLRLFKEMGWHFTSWAVAQAMEKNPSFGKACVRDGHEIAAHGLRWLDIGEMTVEEEKEYIRENALSLERTTGVFPKGYFCGRASPNIRGLYPEVMKEMGRKLLYSSESCFNDDVPYWMDLPWEKSLKDEEKEGLLVIPYNYDCNGWSYSSFPAVKLLTGSRWKVLHVTWFHRHNLPRLPERNFRHVVPRGLQRKSQTHEHTHTFQNYGQARTKRRFEEVHVICEGEGW